MMSLGHGEIDVLVLQALVRKLVAKGVLSPDDVRSLLLDAAKGLDLVGSELTAEAAHIIVQKTWRPHSWGADQVWTAQTAEMAVVRFGANNPRTAREINQDGER